MKTISKIYNKLMLREKTVRQVIEECLNEIKKKDENIKAILRIYSDEFLNSQIENAQKMICLVKVSYICTIGELVGNI